MSSATDLGGKMPPGKKDRAKEGQLALALGSPKPQFDPAAFIVSDSNRDAVAAARAFVETGDAALAICGAAGSGKTHLAHVVARANPSAIHEARDLEGLHGDRRPLLVIDEVAACDRPKLVLALLEDRKSRGLQTALTGRGRPGDWARGLKDLVTRLESMPRATLGEPDENLMRAVIEQRFRDRQWRTSAGVAAYAAPRLPRTFAAAAAFVEAIGAAALAGSRPISPALAREVLDSLSEGIPGA